ncbi:MAG: hypothetical protein NTX52_05215, partial [Planctomycetota bacterium]|nr:hypothetical protein [Planctomycetota bacterium]
MAIEHEDSGTTDLPRSVVELAQKIFSEKADISDEVLERVKQVLPQTQFSIAGRDKGDTSKPTDYASTSAAAFAAEPAETKQGGKLLEHLKADAEAKGKKKVGPRSIVEFVNNLFHAEMLVCRTQTTKRHPAHFERAPHIIRSRSGVWQLNFHEAGHALSNLLSDNKRSWYKKFSDALAELTKEAGSMASAKTPEEGMAELVRKYITDYKSIPAKLMQDFEATLSEIAPDLLAGLRDAHRAYSFWRSRPIMDQLQTIQTDKPPRPSRIEAITNVAHRALYNFVGGSTVINRLIRNSFKGITGEGKFSGLDVAGVVGLIRSKLNKAYRSQLNLARQFREQIKDTSSDIESAYQATLHLVQETQRALYGVKKGREGIRVYSTGKGFAELSEDEIKTLKIAGFIIPHEQVYHGQWIYLSDKSISAVKHDVGLENWDAFVLYGQYRAALERYKEKGQDYPGRADGLTPEIINTWLRQQEKENPDWHGHFKKINEYMDQLLLVSVLSGEYTTADAVTIKKAWADYWPLPRQVEDRPARRSGAGAEPTSGVRGAHGSPLPFTTLDEALELRTKMALEAYYTNRLMLAMRKFNKVLGSLKGASFDVRKDALRLMLPLHLETKKVAALTDEEQGAIIADYLNEQIAKRMGVSVAELKLTGNDIKPEDVEISTPGRPVWRAGKPGAVHIIAPFENGKRRYYQLTDPLLFDLLTKGKKPSKYFNWLTHAMINMIAPWRRALTQNIGFALANTLSRDPSNAGFIGADDWKSLIPFFYAGTGLINRLKGKGINMDATSQSELLSKALDHTTKDAHQSIVGSF